MRFIFMNRILHYLSLLGKSPFVASLSNHAWKLLQNHCIANSLLFDNAQNRLVERLSANGIYQKSYKSLLLEFPAASCGIIYLYC